MLFEPEGVTFSEFVLAQRLDRAYAMRLDSRHAGRRVSDIAFTVCFGDLSYFNRCFRRRFNETPSAVRAEVRRSNGATGPSSAPFGMA